MLRFAPHDDVNRRDGANRSFCESGHGPERGRLCYPLTTSMARAGTATRMRMASVVPIECGRLALRRRRERTVRLAGIEFPRAVIIGVSGFFVLAILFAGTALAFISSLADNATQLLLLVLVVGIFKIALASILFLTLAQEDRHGGRVVGPATRVWFAPARAGQGPLKTELAPERGSSCKARGRMHAGGRVRFLWLVRSLHHVPRSRS